jgi:hypothetical protein
MCLPQKPEFLEAFPKPKPALGVLMSKTDQNSARHNGYWVCTKLPRWLSTPPFFFKLQMHGQGTACFGTETEWFCYCFVLPMSCAESS